MQLKPFPQDRAPITVPLLRSRKNSQQKISACTAYDYTTALIVDGAGVDVVLVGDSLAGVVQGLDTTLPVTLEETIYHCRCVSRGVRRALVVGDMPFMSYQISPERALESAFRIVKEGGVSAVKLEGGVAVKDTVRRLVELDVPVMGHIGLTPQSVHRMGGYKVQGRTDGRKIIDDALALSEAGVFSIVIEGVPDDLAQEITSRVLVPTIGIGAGPQCDGQILVFHDLTGFASRGPVPRFVKQYADLFGAATAAVKQYVKEVQSGEFPSEEFCYGKRKKL